VAYRETANYDGAYRLLDELVAAGVKTYKVYYNYAACYLRQNRLTEAQEAAGRARSLNTVVPEPVLLLARINFAQHDYQAAKDNFEWAIAHTRWPVESFYWLGRCRLELGELPQALIDLEKAVERISDDPNLSDVPAAEAQEWLERARTLAAEQKESEEEAGTVTNQE
jgi:tetratricopeptide (TPR) repeat protein